MCDPFGSVGQVTFSGGWVELKGGILVPFEGAGVVSGSGSSSTAVLLSAWLVLVGNETFIGGSVKLFGRVKLGKVRLLHSVHECDELVPFRFQSSQWVPLGMVRFAHQGAVSLNDGKVALCEGTVELLAGASGSVSSVCSSGVLSSSVGMVVLLGGNGNVKFCVPFR